MTRGESPPASDVVYGIDVGGTKVLGVAVAAQGDIVAEARVPTPAGGPELAHRGLAAALEGVVRSLDHTVAASLPGSGTPVPVGIGAPGLVDGEGRLRFAPNLASAHGVDWTELAATCLPGRRVVVENDANVAVLAEHRLGAARAYRHVVMVTLGTGIGGGIVVDDRVLLGSAGFAGEVGHMVVDPHGPACPCGRRGCWERFASGAGLGDRAREAARSGLLAGVVERAGGDPEDVRGEDVSAAAAGGDPEARRVIEQVGGWIGLGLANLAAVLDPECFVLGGGVVEAGPLLVDAARVAFRGQVMAADHRPLAGVVPAAFGERSGAVGAALAARQGGLA